METGYRQGWSTRPQKTVSRCEIQCVNNEKCERREVKGRASPLILPAEGFEHHRILKSGRANFKCQPVPSSTHMCTFLMGKIKDSTGYLRKCSLKEEEIGFDVSNPVHDSGNCS